MNNLTVGKASFSAYSSVPLSVSPSQAPDILQRIDVLDAKMDRILNLLQILSGERAGQESLSQQTEEEN